MNLETALTCTWNLHSGALRDGARVYLEVYLERILDIEVHLENTWREFSSALAEVQWRKPVQSRGSQCYLVSVRGCRALFKIIDGYLAITWVAIFSITHSTSCRTLTPFLSIRTYTIDEFLPLRIRVYNSFFSALNPLPPGFDVMCYWAFRQCSVGKLWKVPVGTLSSNTWSSRLYVRCRRRGRCAKRCSHYAGMNMEGIEVSSEGHSDS